jgi:branched-chain amino acid transport system permease protein
MIELGVLIAVTLDAIAFLSIYLIISLSLNLQYGYAGLPNFGISASVAIGAFTVSMIDRLVAMLYSIDPNLDWTTNDWRIVSQINSILCNDPLGAMVIFGLILIAALLAGGAIGLIMTYPAIRLRADYLLIVLIAMSEAVRLIGVNFASIAGGTIGFQVIDPFSWLGDARPIGLILLFSALVALTFLLVQKMTNSPFGRLLRAVRDNETTVISVGKAAVKVKLVVMILGSMLASLAGALFTFYIGTTIPRSYTRNDWTFWPWLMVMVGGKGNNKGVVLGALFVILARRILDYGKYMFAPFLPFDIVWLENILIGTVLIAVIAFKPKGMLSEKPIRIKSLHKDRTQRNL